MGRFDFQSPVEVARYAISHGRTNPWKNVIKRNVRLRGLGGNMGRLLLVGVQFELRDGMLKTRPFFGHKGHKFQTKLLRTTPPDHGFLNLERRLLVRGLDANLEGRSRSYFGYTIDPAAAEREIDDTPVTTDNVQ